MSSNDWRNNWDPRKSTLSLKEVDQLDSLITSLIDIRQTATKGIRTRDYAISDLLEDSALLARIAEEMRT